MKPYSNLSNYGAKTYPDGSEYHGQLVNGKRQGKGRWAKKKFECYDGDWNNDKYHGNGALIMPSISAVRDFKKPYCDHLLDADRYEGQFSDGAFHGEGTLFYSFRAFYKGSFVNGKKEGDGSETYLTGYVYAGSFSNDKPHGKGVLLKGDYSYDGEFSEGKKNGHGVEQYPNGSIYEGQFANNRRYGKGKLKKKDGSYYQGEWFDDLKHGYASEIMIDSTGETIYEGEFKYGLKSGFGRLTLPNDSYYYGHWHLDSKHGEFLHFDRESEKFTIRYFQNDEEIDTIDCPQKFPPELDAYRDMIESYVFKGKRVVDQTFEAGNQAFQSSQLLSFSLDSIEWQRASDIYKNENLPFFTGFDPENSLVKYSKHSDYQLMSCLDALKKSPSTIASIYSYNSQPDTGYFMLKFIIGGKHRQILVDDYLPVFKSSQEFVFSASSKPQDLCISLIEKAYAKLHGSYFAFVKEPKEPDYILSILTGLPSEVASTSDEKHILELLTNPTRFPICFAKPKEDSSEKHHFPPGFFFTIQEIIMSDGGSGGVVKLNSIDPSIRIESSWNEKYKTWSPDLLKKHEIRGNHPEQPGEFWISLDELLAEFDKIYVSLAKNSFYVNSALGLSNKDANTITQNEMRYFEIRIPKLIEVDIIVEQIMGFDNSVYPMRIILAHKIGDSLFEYIGGKGQTLSKSSVNSFVLPKGTYVLGVHLETPPTVKNAGGRDVLVTAYASNHIQVTRTMSQLTQFLPKAFGSLAKKHGEKTDLSNVPNGDKKLLMFEYFSKEQGAFIQVFENNTNNIKWRYSAHFTLHNMRIVGAPNFHQQVDVTIEPRKSKTIIIFQTGGLPFEFIGGEGTINLELLNNMQK